MKKWVTLFFLSALVSCEKDITIHTDQQPPKLVVEGQIENGQAPIIVLSSSLDYFSTIDAATLNATYVHAAKVTIGDGTRTYTLKENSIPLTGGYFFYYYTTPQSNPLTTLFGDFGKTYTLKIESAGQVYNATATIPFLTKKIDSLWWKKAPNNTDTLKTVLMARVTDPPGLGNYIRYFTKQNRDDFYPGLNSVFDDQIIDGKTYDIQVDRGVARNEKIERGDYGFFKRGDTATVKFCNIDKASYNFWRTWEFTYQSVGNPFSSPGKVLGNIDNGGLGSFCGYAVQYKTLIIPK
jgi:hypothetical protein